MRKLLKNMSPDTSQAKAEHRIRLYLGADPSCFPTREQNGFLISRLLDGWGHHLWKENFDPQEIFSGLIRMKSEPRILIPRCPPVGEQCEVRVSNSTKAHGRRSGTGGGEDITQIMGVIKRTPSGINFLKCFFSRWKCFFLTQGRNLDVRISGSDSCGLAENQRFYTFF